MKDEQRKAATMQSRRHSCEAFRSASSFILQPSSFLDCRRGGSNPYTFRYRILSPARLPIPPLLRGKPRILVKPPLQVNHTQSWWSYDFMWQSRPRQKADIEFPLSLRACYPRIPKRPRKRLLTWHSSADRQTACRVYCEGS